MFNRKSDPPKSTNTTPSRPTTGAAPAPSAARPFDFAPALLALDFSRQSADDLVDTNGAPIPGLLIQGGVLHVPPGCGVVSKGSVSVKGVEMMRCLFEVKGVRDAANGAPANFFIGPVGRDAAGAIVLWWTRQNALRVSEGVRKLATEVRIPPSVETVQIGVMGSWSETPPAGDAVLGLLNARLFKA